MLLTDQSHGKCCGLFNTSSPDGTRAQGTRFHYLGWVSCSTRDAERVSLGGRSRITQEILILVRYDCFSVRNGFGTRCGWPGYPVWSVTVFVPEMAADSPVWRQFG